MRPTPMHVRLGYRRSPPPWGSRKELAFVLCGDCLCLISQGLPSRPCEMSLIVQGHRSSGTSGDVTAQTQPLEHARGRSTSALPVPEPVLPPLPTLGIVWGEGFEHSLPLVSSVLYFQAFPLLCLHGGSTIQITPVLCGGELLGLHYPDHSSLLSGGAPWCFLEGWSDTGVEGEGGRGSASCLLLIPSV